MGCGCFSVGLHACTTAPITERRQLKLIPESKLNAQAAQLYEKVKKKAKLSDDLSTLVLVRSLSVEEVLLDYGPLASQNYLIEISKLINKLATKSVFVGYLDHGCFAIICNIMTTDQVKPVTERIVCLLNFNIYVHIFYIYI